MAYFIGEPDSNESLVEYRAVESMPDVHGCGRAHWSSKHEKQWNDGIREDNLVFCECPLCQWADAYPDEPPPPYEEMRDAESSMGASAASLELLRNLRAGGVEIPEIVAQSFACLTDAQADYELALNAHRLIRKVRSLRWYLDGESIDARLRKNGVKMYLNLLERFEDRGDGGLGLYKALAHHFPGWKG